MATEIHIQNSIVANAKLGQINALEWLYNNYSTAMFNICCRMLGNKNDAEDVLQDVFVLAFNNLHQLKEAMQFGGWIKRITINECIKFCKKNNYSKVWNDDYVEDKANSEDELVWWQHLSMPTIINGIKKLPDGCRQIFNLYAIENYGHKEIATLLNITEGTSKSQYHRAKKLLKEQLTKEYHHG